MTVLVVGGGGREHALVWRLRQEQPAAEIIAAPGNPGIAELARCVPVSGTDVDGLVALARAEGVDWTLVGPEAPLAAGLADAFAAAGQPVFGPTRAAALLETSKAFAKSVMVDAGVPTALARTCTTAADARRAVEELGAPVVVKASGLAAGKGVMVCRTPDEAREAVRLMFDQRVLGAAADTVLVEQFMAGEELSLFVLTDGTRAIPLPCAQDHKRLLNDDAGPNTGGMGAYAPVSRGDDALVTETMDRIVAPTLDAMRARGTPFAGLLYVGLMLTDEGPSVVEFNCRFGDPETQAVLPALGASAPIGELMAGIARGAPLDTSVVLRADRDAVTTVLAASGYPERPRSGDAIALPAIPDDVLVFHAGTARAPTGALITAGGRVLSVTGVGASFDEARERSQSFAAAVAFAGKQYRTDIGWREQARRAGAA